MQDKQFTVPGLVGTDPKLPYKRKFEDLDTLAKKTQE
jgi:hypothetical protein